jgi:hypothetical protein
VSTHSITVEPAMTSGPARHTGLRRSRRLRREAPRVPGGPAYRLALSAVWSGDFRPERCGWTGPRRRAAPFRLCRSDRKCFVVPAWTCDVVANHSKLYLYKTRWDVGHRAVAEMTTPDVSTCFLNYRDAIRIEGQSETVLCASRAFVIGRIRQFRSSGHPHRRDA